MKSFLALLRKKYGRTAIGHKVEDILQEAWLKAYRHRDQFDPESGPFEVWFYRIALNCATDVLRRFRREISTVSYEAIRPTGALPLSPPGDRDDPDRRRLLERLAKVLGRLPQSDQKMFQFYATYKGDDWQRVYAERMGLEREAVQNQFDLVSKRIWSKLGKSEPGAER